MQRFNYALSIHEFYIYIGRERERLMVFYVTMVTFWMTLVMNK